MPKKIILIRHGETDHNKQGKAQGWLDVSLNKTGLKQAQKLARRLKDEVIDVIYTSDLKRAFQTTKPFSKLKKIKPIKTKKVREWNMGTWADKTWDKIQKEFAHIFDEKGDLTDQDWKGHAGESINEVFSRAEKFLKELSKKHPGKTVVVTTHGGTKKRILKLLGILRMDENPKINNTGVTILEKDKDGKYKATVFNDASHLEDYGSKR